MIPVRFKEESRGDLYRSAEELEEERQRDAVDGSQLVAARDVIGASPTVPAASKR